MTLKKKILIAVCFFRGLDANRENKATVGETQYKVHLLFFFLSNQRQFELSLFCQVPCSE